MIEEYYFGNIIIDGKTYNYDVEVRFSGEVLSWQRRQSHIIEIKDVKRAIEESPEIIVIGTGESGIAQVMEETKDFINEKGIRLIIDLTGEAIKIFNDSVKEKAKKVIGLFHLTC